MEHLLSSIHWKTRWVWGPVETDSAGQILPLVRSFVQQWFCPADALDATSTMTCCVMDAKQLQAVRADARFVVLESLHNTQSKIHTDIVGKLGKHGVSASMNTHDLLKHLANKFHPAFEPEV